MDTQHPLRMRLARALTIGLAAGFGIGLAAALLAGVRPEIAVLRALLLAFGAGVLAILAVSLNSAPIPADKSTGVSEGDGHAT